MVFTRVIGAVAALTLIAGVAGVGSAHAQMPPAGRLFGTVTVDGSDAADGTVIVAHVNSADCGQATYDGSKSQYYVDLDSSQSDCATAGNTVWFSVGSCTAYNTGVVPEFSGAEEVDLIAPGSC